MRLTRILIALTLVAMPAMAAAQLVQLPVPGLPGRVLGQVEGQVDGLAGDLPVTRQITRVAHRLVNARAQRLRNLVRRYPDRIELDRHGNPVRAGEVVVTDPDDALIAAARDAGFRLLARDSIDDLGISFARFATPSGDSLRHALKRMRRLAGSRDVSTDPLHFESGEAAAMAPSMRAEVPASPAGDTLTPVGIIDGGVNAAAIAARLDQRGFATGAPRPSDHGTEVASLIAGGSGIRGAVQNVHLHVADVYGSDPAGGSATAIARAIGWMVSDHVPVVSVSLVGPANPLLARVVAAARKRGTVLVAAVGNDGPAAPPSYPASYPGVIAVTAVDGHDRALIEAGRAGHLDYAAPGADMRAANAEGKAVRVRGTSFAVPLVAARLAAVYAAPDAAHIPAALNALDHEAKDLGSHGPDPVYGRGLLCEKCTTN
ncbi:S8 family serine peptidase [Stakelama sediminis]|uniref:Peptidase S8/S53 domain-containing protein n=1 Tax=Stakelama sediminis TaxID=463200 RepID=A0A840YWG2_9SPHN|nr:S8 family serine peptidase [Stakelama sediminis]MBB5717889.1 hypothetical protein [Stakelama sediminis]